MQPSPELDTIARLAIASLCGLAVGVEREWSGKAPGTHARFAGVRTLFMLGGMAGVAGYLLATGMVVAGAVLLAGGIAIVVTAYAMSSRADAPGALDATTEVAALVVLALGVIAGLGNFGLASGATAIVVVALQEKTRLHGAIAEIDEHELRATFHFAVLALVVLPVLPNASYGPLGGIRPRELWMIVLIFSGLNFLGYLARKVVGRSRGDIVAGALGGLMSSTAVTWTFARRSRDEEAASTTLALGVVAACTVLLPRVVIISAVLNVSVARALLPIIVVPFLVGLGVLGWSLFARPAPPHPPVPVEDTSPLRFWSAMKMALAFQVSLMAIHYASTMLGDRGVLASAAVLGLTDTDALTLSMNRLGEAPDMVSLAATAIGVGVTANTVLKAGVMAALGSPRFRVVGVTGLAAMLIALVGALVLA